MHWQRGKRQSTVPSSGSTACAPRDDAAARAVTRASRHRLVFAALLIVLLSLAIRLPWATFAHVTPVRDFRDYHNRAIALLEHGQVGWKNSIARRTPGYPGFLAAVYRLAGVNRRAVFMVQACLGALASGLLVLLMGQFLAVRTAVVAGILHALSPTAVAYTAILASENVAVPLAIATFLSAAVADRQKGGRLFLGVSAVGLLFAALVYVRPAAMFILPAVLAVLFWSPQRRIFRLWPPVVCLLTVVLALCPWLYRNYSLGFPPTTLATVGGTNLYVANNSRAGTGLPFKNPEWAKRLREGPRDAEFRRVALAWICAHPARYFSLCRTRAVTLAGIEPDGWPAQWLRPTRANDELAMAARDHVFRGAAMSQDRWRASRVLVETNQAFLRGVRLVLLPLAVCGLFLSLSHRRLFMFCTLPYIVYVTALSFYFVNPRMREMVDPFLLTLAAVACTEVLFNARELMVRMPWLAKAAITAVLLIASLGAGHAGWFKAAGRLPRMDATEPTDTAPASAPSPRHADNSGTALDRRAHAYCSFVAVFTGVTRIRHTPCGNTSAANELACSPRSCCRQTSRT